MAVALGRPPNWLYQVVNGKHGILIPTLRELAMELGVSAGSLLDPPGQTIGVEETVSTASTETRE